MTKPRQPQDHSEPEEQAPSTDQKKPYQSPRLEKLGSVTDLTGGADLSGGEGVGYS